ncbi:MAG: ABC transporter substrate-binding protein [Lactobacillales bacterium]|jgi:ABC-type branched-subunit amino acid transport system substrate-binding protein|nr:ABC transporter substrate-binding protein [Lactobacillales bacterium]
MKRTGGWIVLGIIILFMACAFIWHMAPRDRNDKPVIRIGAIIPLTGNLSDAGQAYKEAIEIAIKEINETNAKYHYEAIIEDNVFDTAKTVLITKKMQALYNPLMIISVGSGNAFAINSALGGADIFQFAVVYNPDVSKRRLSHNYFTHPKDMAQKSVERMRHLGVKKVNIFAAKTAAVESLMRYLPQTLEENKIQYNLVTFNPSERDFHLMIRKAFQNPVDLSLLVAQPPAVEILVRQLREYDPTLKLAATTDVVATNHPELFDGIWFLDKDEPSARRKALFGTQDQVKLQNMSAGYEAARLFIDMIESLPYNDGQVDIQALEDKIMALKEYDVDGTIVSTDKDGFIGFDVSYRIFKDGKIIPLDETGE